MKLYLFKRAADGVWIFGNNADCEHQAGICKPVPSTDRTKVSIIYFQKNDATPSIYDIPVVNFLDEAGVAYADFAALKAGCYGFFSTPVGEGTGGETTGGLTDAQLRAAAVPVTVPGNNVGVCDGCIAAALSDTVDLVHPGYIQPRLLAGNIKVTDMNGNDSTLDFDLKEVSTFRVKRVWVAGTTANMGIVVIY